MQNPKEKIRTLISDSKIREAIKTFFESVPSSDGEMRNKLTVLNGKFSSLENEKWAQQIKDEDYKVECNRLANAVLAFADEFFGILPTQNLNTLETTIAHLPPLSIEADLGLLQLVNCDRAKPIRHFNALFGKKTEAKQPFQFYFLTGCPDEMPHSLAERILFELKDKLGENQHQSVNYPFTEGEFQRVKIENLPLSTADLSASKKKFKAYVQKRFAFADTESFERFIETGLPKLPYGYVATVFKIAESEWDEAENELIDYLQWMIDTFQTPHPDVPTFIFLFVLPFRNLHDEKKVKKRQLDLIQRLELFCEQNKTAVFKEIAPIRQTHFEDWLSNLGIDNPNDYEPLSHALYAALKLEDQLLIDDEPHLHMKDVEPIQKKVILHYRNKNQ